MVVDSMLGDLCDEQSQLDKIFGITDRNSL